MADDARVLITRVEKAYDLQKVYHSQGEQELTLPALISDVQGVIDRFLLHEGAKGSALATPTVPVPVPGSTTSDEDDPLVSKEGLLDDDAEAAFLTFFKKSMPIVVELLLRRKTSIEHEEVVSGLFIAVIRLLAQPFAAYIPELCNLRNALLFHSSMAWRFVNPKALKVAAVAGPSFFAEMGRPNIAIFPNNARVAFWPDEWAKILGGAQAVGHWVRVLQAPPPPPAPTSSSSSPSSSHSQHIDKDMAAVLPPEPCSSPEKVSSPQIWRTGWVSAYNADQDVYTINFDDSSASGSGSGSEDVALQSVLHEWVDVANSDRPESRAATLAQQEQQEQQKQQVRSETQATKVSQEAQLSNGATDVGQYIRIWWSRYNKHFYGNITAFDEATQQHSVTYEDGDTRLYDLKQRKWDLISPPASLDISPELPVATRSGIVAAWHRESNLSPLDFLDSKKNAAHHKYAIERPHASQSQPPSTHFVRMLNAFIRAGGISTIMQSLRSPDRLPPLIKVLNYDMQFIRGLRHYLSTSGFADLVKELADSVPLALDRLEDSHFKHITTEDTQELFMLLTEVFAHIPPSPQGDQNDKKESVELMRLNLAARMLRCTQLQKRYQGLAMIKDEVDSLLPTASSFVSRRLAALSSSKSGDKQQQQQQQYNTGGRSAQSSYHFDGRSSTAPPQSSLMLTSPAFERWLVSNEIVEELFGKSLHQDLVAKSDVILVFLAYRKVLTERHIEVLWQSTKGVHEVVVRVIHQLILLIVPVLEPGLRMYLFGLASSFSPRECTEQLLHLIKNFTVQTVIAIREETENRGLNRLNTDSSSQSISMQSLSDIVSAPPQSSKDDMDAVKRALLAGSSGGNGFRKLMGFSVLWDLVQDASSASSAENTLDAALCSLAIQLLVELLQAEFKDEREAIMKKCLGNIQVGLAVPSSLQILRKTLGTYPEPQRNWLSLGRSSANARNPTVEFQIDRFHKQFRMMDTVFFDLERFSSTAPTGNDKAVPSLGGRNPREPTGPGGETTRNPKALTRLDGAANSERHLREVAERLEFLRFVLSRSTLSLDFRQSSLIWHALGEGAVTLETIDTLVRWLDGLMGLENRNYLLVWQNLMQESDPSDPSLPSKLHHLAAAASLGMDKGKSQERSSPQNPSASSSGDSSDPNASGGRTVFDEGVLVRLFENRILKWATRAGNIDLLSRPPVAIFCLKMFVLTNLSNKSLKIESDGSWSRIGQLSGLALLWRMAIDSKESVASGAAQSMLVELHHRLPPKSRSTESIQSHFLRMCFKELSAAIQSIRVGDSPDNDSAHRPAVESGPPDAASNLIVEAEGFPVIASSSSQRLAGACGASVSDAQSGQVFDDWLADEGSGVQDMSVIGRRVARFIVLLQQFIRRFRLQPAQLMTIKVLFGREDANILTLSLNSTETLGTLRAKVAEHFKEQPAAVIMLHNVRSPGLFMGSNAQEVLERDDWTLRQARLLPIDSIVVKKKEAVVAPPTPSKSAVQALPPAAPAVADLISPTDLKTNLLSVLYPWYWLDEGSNRIKRAAEGATAPALQPRLLSTLSTMLKMPDSPLPAHSDATLFSSPGSGPVTRDDAAPSMAEQLAASLRHSPGHADQLLEMLDGYLSANLLDYNAEGNEGPSRQSGVDLCSAVWDVLQSLPVHEALLKQVRDMPLDPSGASIVRNLNLHSRYRLLYTLQIMDALLAGTNDIQRGHTPDAVGRAVSEWATQFIHLGGAEHLLSLLKGMLAKALDQGILAGGPEKPAETPGAPAGGLSRMASGQDLPSLEVVDAAGLTSPDNATALTIALLYRLLHRLLLFDPAYADWQLDSFSIPRSRSGRGQAGSSQVPTGLVLTCLDPAALVRLSFLSTYCMAKTSEAAALGQGAKGLSDSAVQAVAENSLRLIFGLVAACDEGASLLPFSLDGSVDTAPGDALRRSGFEEWLREMCVGSTSALVRSSCSRRVLEMCTTCLFLCSDRGISVEKRAVLWTACDFLFFSVVRASVEDDARSALQGEEMYSLVSALTALRSAPDLVFTRDFVAKCRLRETLQEMLSSPSPHRVAPEMLCELFLKKLFAHRSSETFHSRLPDGTLLGILRVLLILATGGPTERFILGAYCPTPNGPTDHLAVSTAVPEQSTPSSSTGGQGHLILHLYQHRLFPTLSGGTNVDTSSALTGAACLTHQSRDLAYALLYQLCVTDEKNLLRLVAVINGTVPSFDAAAPRPERVTAEAEAPPASVAKDAAKESIQWSYFPGSLMKEENEHIGLVNQGGTCYMNSFLQQLFHVPEFADGLLAIGAEDESPGEPALSSALVPTPASPSASPDGEEVLFQLQRLFGYLRFSQKRYYDTLPFCRAFRDYDGQPISLHEQKDINEFAGMLFEKLESSSRCRALLDQTIRGKVVWLTKSTETPYQSSREEPFYMITAEVKDKERLEDSLELLCAEELFSGDNKLEDPVAGRKVEALRRCAIRVLPPTLIVHLKRFEFDLETMARKKVNDFITFPMELNMRPYTEEGIADRTATEPEVGKEKEEEDGGECEEGGQEVEDGAEGREGAPSASAAPAEASFPQAHPASYYEYTLKGVVAHSGAIDRGHYYSFIRDRSSRRWFEFNDRSVLPFSAEAIPLECFGGAEKSDKAGPARMRQNNAYLLLYERKERAEAVPAAAAQAPMQVGPSAQPSASLPSPPPLADDCVEKDGYIVLPPPPPSPATATAAASAAATSAAPEKDPTPAHVAASLPSNQSRILQDVWAENTEFLTDRCLFDVPHFRFMWQLLQMPSAVKILRNPALTLDGSGTGAGQGRNTPSPQMFDDSPPSVDPQAGELALQATGADLAHLGLVCLRFNVEVLARARAQACVPLFFERLEEIILQDAGRSCAERVLDMLGAENAHWLPQREASAVRRESRSLSNAASPTGQGTGVRERPRDRDMVSKLCHPWLVQVYIQCPYAATAKAFSKFLLACLRAMRGRCKDSYLAKRTGDVASPGAASAVAPGEDWEAVQAASRGAQASLGASCVARLVHKLLFVAEKVQVEDVLSTASGANSGYRMLSSLLHQFACLGHQERQVLLSLGAVYRLVCSLLSLNPTTNNIASEHLQPSFELVAMLVRSSTIPAVSRDGVSLEPTGKPRSPFAQPHNDGGTSLLPMLAAEDLQAFLNRVFLEDAIATCPAQTSLALQHVCWSCGDREVLKVLDFVVEKISEFALNPGGVYLSYRAYFRVLSELLLSGSIDMQLAFDAVVPALLQRAEALVVRQGVNDAEFVYSVLKLLHRLGTCSAAGHACVMGCRDQWKNLRHTFIAYQRKSLASGGGGAPPSSSPVAAASYSSSVLAQAQGLGLGTGGFSMS